MARESGFENKCTIRTTDKEEEVTKAGISKESSGSELVPNSLWGVRRPMELWIVCWEWCSWDPEHSCVTPAFLISSSLSVSWSCTCFEIQIHVPLSVDEYFRCNMSITDVAVPVFQRRHNGLFGIWSWYEDHSQIVICWSTMRYSGWGYPWPGKRRSGGDAYSLL